MQKQLTKQLNLAITSKVKSSWGVSSLLLFSVFGLSACNSDDDKTHVTKPPILPDTGFVIVGHRGASALRPEHTLAAYQKAIDDGADFIEPDLVPTKDGYLVARHESEISGTTNISTLSQFADRKTTKKIDGIDYTGWFTEDFNLNELTQNVKARERIAQYRPNNTQYNDQYSIPTLEQIIELAEAHYKKTGKIVGLYIETKHPTFFQQQNLAMEDRLLTTLAKYSYTRDIAPVYLQSFETTNLKYLRDQLTQKKTLKHGKIIQLLDSPTAIPGDLQQQNSPQNYASLATADGLKSVAKYADGVGPSKTYIFSNTEFKQTTFVKDAHAVGLKVHPYTLRPENGFLPDYLKCSSVATERCDTGAAKEFENFYKAGVDGVFADDPGLARKTLTQLQKP
ncbi:glycerophosphodiester phosphodiesterase family protein [Acinetobacter sp. YH01024]|uniref:glycerophosphodiester phosphodiesterase family protein n=1 Tax=Acinetobacter sp. YH01024 TaxID=2601037 RepID=UPI0015D32745|nr:glycerophosphodiester phosphodiesterase family protein [Acinetobacter sp. YH01024]